MSTRLPESVDPWRLADTGTRFEGSIPLRRFERLRAVLADVEGEAAYELAFHRDREKRPLIDGRVRARLSLECQRCLGTMSLPVDSSFHLAVIDVPSEAERVPEGCDPVQAEEGQLSPLALIEDELLLSVPQVPMHERSACPVDPASFESGPDGPPEDGIETSKSPFAALAELKRKRQETS